MSYSGCHILNLHNWQICEATHKYVEQLTNVMQVTYFTTVVFSKQENVSKMCCVTKRFVLDLFVNRHLFLLIMTYLLLDNGIIFVKLNWHICRFLFLFKGCILYFQNTYFVGDSLLIQYITHFDRNIPP